MSTHPSDPSGAGRLVVVATPIGNLEDLSPRAVTALRRAELVAAEDTRRTGRLLARLEVDTPQVSYHDHNADRRAGELVEKIAGGTTVALVTDAGMPAVSDPGFQLVSACVTAGLAVSVVPGPSAVLAALVVSGLPTDRFVFEGFLPRRTGARRDRLAELADEPRTLVVFVSPHRAAEELADLAAALGRERQAAVCRELTKVHEEVLRGELGELAAQAREHELRGEVTAVIAGALRPPRPPPSSATLADEVALRVAAGVDKKTAIAEVADEARVRKRDVYQAVVNHDHP